MNPITTTAPISLNWYDYVVAAVVLYGFYSGLRRGLVHTSLRLVTWALMLVLPLCFYVTAGLWFRDYSGLDGDLSNLVAFQGIAIVVFLCCLAISNNIRYRLSNRKVPAWIDNMGGVLLGAVLMLLVMAWVSIMLSLMRSPFWHEQVAKESCFGYRVVQQFPPVAAMTEKQQKPEQLWFMKPIQRRSEPTPDTKGPR